MKITNLNPADEIGASAWVVETDGHRMLMDAGIHPKREGRDGLPLLNLIEGTDLDALAITHCHHDHIGAVPVALRPFPKAHVVMTEASYFIIERVLHNSVNVMMRQREESGIREYPLFTHDEVDELAPRFQGFGYNREIEWAAYHKTRAGATSPTLEFYDAGHALGSAGIMVRSRRETLFYTGDVSFGDQTILKGARFEDVKADVLIMETTRGNRPVPAGFTRAAEIERLTASMDRVLKRKGSVLIPTFALGRTQEILAMLALNIRAGRLKNQPIYIGGLGRVFTEIYDLQAHRTHRQHSNLKLTGALNLIVLDRNQIDKMKMTGGRILVLTAGMMNEHTAAHEVALRVMGDEKHLIAFVGYADPDTPGGRLKVSELGREFLFSGGAGMVTRRCELEDFDLTAHANRDELLDFVTQVSPRTVVLGHGQPEARQWFDENIRRRHPKMRVVQPKPGETIEA
jgi:Cft2 family RNA processing exonuclease